MKITRLKRGYRISLSDSAMEALTYLVDLARADIVDDGMLSPVSPAAKRHLKGRFMRFDAMGADEDRRGIKAEPFQYLDPKTIPPRTEEEKARLRERGEPC